MSFRGLIFLDLHLVTPRGIALQKTKNKKIALVNYIPLMSCFCF